VNKEKEDTMKVQTVSQATGNAPGQAVRLAYMDWLRLIATLGVFVFHTTCVFNNLDFHIKNAEQSQTLTLFVAFLFPWGMPLFFLISGAGTWFALKRRSPGQYARERFARLLIPFLVGSLLLTPVQLYFEWSHKIQTGVAEGTFLEFVQALPWGTNSRIFGVVGYHLWFLGFLFCYSLLARPLFRWLKEGAGRQLVSRLAHLCERRGATLLFILPLLPVRLGLHAFFPYEHDWADFFVLFCYFVFGFLIFADERFTQAIRRDWPILLTVGSATFLAGVALALATGELDIEAPTRTPATLLFWTLFTACGWCWTAVMLFVGMRFLNASNKVLQYGKEALLPFFVLHQPAVIVVAYFVVQLEAGLWPKLLAVLAIAFAVSLGLVQFGIRRVGPLRSMFGMKAVQPAVPVAAAGH
jgi:glucan biosynthesis protein C